MKLTAIISAFLAGAARASGVVTGLDGSVGTDTLRSIEGIQGTNFGDTYVATGFNGSSANAGSARASSTCEATW